MKYAYYPGCSGYGTSKEYEASTQAVIKALGLNFYEVEDWSCCGSTPAHSLDNVLSAALSARNLMQASFNKIDGVVTPCPSCLSNLKLARHRMQKPDFKAKVDELLDSPTPEDAASLPDTFSFLQILVEQVGLDAISKAVVKPLSGVKVACYYGCLMSRPKDVMNFDDPENPMAIDNLMVALGAEVVPFSLKTECCGASFGISRRDITSNLVGRILETAKAFGADAVVTACPLCHMNLDLRQVQADRTAGTKFDLPVFYFTQLLGFALGLSGKDLILEKLVVSPQPFFAKIAASKAAKEESAPKAEASKPEAPESPESADAKPEEAAAPAPEGEGETKKDEGGAS